MSADVRPAEDDATPRDVIRSVTRALDLLAVLNEHEAISLMELHQTLGLPKSTLHRLLATLCHAGYVQADDRAGAYRVTQNVRVLGAGYTRRSMVVDIGAPIAKQVTREIRWPLAIGTLEGSVIVVRYSTMPYSPLAFQATTVGHRLSLVNSASGMAYLAFCDDAQREILIDVVTSDAQEQQVIERSIRAGVRSAQKRSYGLRLPNRVGDTATVAVPILHGAEILGVLSMTIFGRLLNHRLLAEHVPILKETAQRISDAVRQAQGGD